MYSPAHIMRWSVLSAMIRLRMEFEQGSSAGAAQRSKIQMQNEERIRFTQQRQPILREAWPISSQWPNAIFEPLPLLLPRQHSLQLQLSPPQGQPIVITANHAREKRVDRAFPNLDVATAEWFREERACINMLSWQNMHAATTNAVTIKSLRLRPPIRFGQEQ